jgi:branched-chain amino acid transport system substrate-binding protein
MRRRAFGAALAAAVAALALPRPVLAIERLKLPLPPPARPRPPGLRVGLVLAGGPFAAASADIAAGFDLALSEAASGLTRHISILRDDGDGTPGSSVVHAKRLLDAGAVDILVAPVNPGDAAALRDLADAARVPLIIPAPAGAGVKCSPYLVNLAPTLEQSAGPLGAWLGGQKPVRHVYLLAPQDAAARAQVAAFKRAFEAGGGEVVGEEYVPGANPDFSPYLAKLRLVGADAIYAPFSGSAAAELAKQYESLGLDKQRVVLAGAGVAPSNLESGIVSAADYAPGLDALENKRFRTEFASRFGRAALAAAARGYDAGRMIVETARLAALRAEAREPVASLLTRVSFTGPRGPVRLDPRGGAAVAQIFIVRARNDAAAAEILERVTPAAPSAALCMTPAGS